jgi:paraquat-inducible protein B
MPDEPADSQTASSEPIPPRAVIASPAQVTQSQLRTRLWWLTALCGLLAVGLVLSSFRQQGTPIDVFFDDGYGLKVGDTLRYRGIDVGQVTAVGLADDFTKVHVKITLTPGHENIAVDGSKFWIERARVRVGEIRGLETVLGANYVSVIPGDSSGPRQREFVGLETPLAMATGDSQDIAVQFPAGEGLQIGDHVLYRGIRVGEVTQVELSEQADAVIVRVRLVGVARNFARVGTQFWIERPRLDLTEVRGLETLVAGRYLTFQPGRIDATAQQSFVGLSEPPPIPRRDGSLEIELDAPKRSGLVRGAPITYRGLEVGHIATVGLSKDGASVKVAGVIHPEYTELVRANSKWWVVGGIEFDAGLRGVQVSMESLTAWIRGGVAFATPPDAGDKVVTGHRYMLESEPLPEWLEWQPRIAVGAGRSASLTPTPIRIVASWQASWLGLFRRRTIETWGMAIDDGSLIVPASFVAAARDSGTQVNIEVAGKSWPFDSARVAEQGTIATIPVPAGVSLERWPRRQLADARERTNTLLLVNPELNEPLAIDPTRVGAVDAASLQIAPGVSIASALEGSPIIDATSSKVVGILVRRDNQWFIGRIK